jgi:hypothetical protein
VLFAFEFDTDLFPGQADGGGSAGRYLELSVAPGYAGSKASIAVPIKVGLSLADDYELSEFFNGGDSSRTIGSVSIGFTY